MCTSTTAPVFAVSAASTVAGERAKVSRTQNRESCSGGRFSLERDCDMPDLSELIRKVIEDHRATGQVGDAGASCSCGAEGLSDHPRHVAEQIIERLRLKPQDIDETKKQIRYATAWLDWELTILEGAQC